jgi:hypothetical protein
VTRPAWARSRTRAGRRSKFEDTIAESLEARGADAEYEKLRITYTDTRAAYYKPDWQLRNGIIVEAKGYFKSTDRAKHLLIKEQHPNLDIRFVFTNSTKRLSKESVTTYAGWCVKHGFKYADKDIPDAWLKEPKK